MKQSWLVDYDEEDENDDGGEGEDDELEGLYEGEELAGSVTGEGQAVSQQDVMRHRLDLEQHDNHMHF